MRKIGAMAAVVACLLSVTACAAEDDSWMTDFEEAKKLAAEKGLPMLVDFSGSDWCGWCIRLDKEVFSKQEFKDYAKDNLVLVMLDFPNSKPQSDELKEQNQKLMKEYEVQGFPTIILMDKDGKVLATTGYQRGGAEAYVEHIKELLADAAKASDAGKSAE